MREGVRDGRKIERWGGGGGGGGDRGRRGRECGGRRMEGKMG